MELFDSFHSLEKAINLEAKKFDKSVLALAESYARLYELYKYANDNVWGYFKLGKDWPYQPVAIFIATRVLLRKSGFEYAAYPHEMKHQINSMKEFVKSAHSQTRKALKKRGVDVRRKRKVLK